MQGWEAILQSGVPELRTMYTTLTSSVSTPATPTHHDLNDSDYSQLSPSSVVDLDPSTHCRDSLFPPHLQRETPKPPAPADRLPPTSFQETHMNTSLVENWIHSAHISPPSFPTSLTSDQEHPQPANEPTHPPSTTEDYETLLIERNAILSLKEFLHTCRPEDATDQIILDAFVLAWPPDTSSGTPLPTSHLQWPMPLQRVEVMEAHIHGLRYLVEARGGLDKLEMLGLAEGLSTYATSQGNLSATATNSGARFDLVTASRNLAKPHWPVKTSLDPNEITRFLDRFSPVLDTGSDHLFAAVQASFNPAAALVFDTLRRYIVLLQEYAQGHLKGLDMAYLLGSRNIIHHRALSLPATHDPPRRRVNEPFRLAVTAFSLLVVFPTPLMARPYPRLAESLRGELGSVEECYQDWIGMPEVLVWVLVLGGMAATGTPQRAWYAGKLRWLVAMLGIVSWEQMRRILKSVVWMENLCVDEGVALWQEIQAC
ncbi:uncharacterized protein ACLA_044090 [Aspergillus clavatus NRRL 1]|uniref:Uncharacterized protein n=1 Tax=Aspergillus clavatus (strain ATCC 1007 / CBS 513.65 / DSM 816 / NCTC 3887 / NRRL 1 / QM 1276 / 107) TaxID=344612 RepID=A1C8Q2_ASPCL|nr:uncharacterized protein ACLA_044090 [Aspergillus clavatus NRRL 1]EAW13689.1 conserved hypothetical protein [Aspergillus clavatus NRRL 1]